MLSPAEEPGAEEDTAEGEEQDGTADKSSTDPEAHRKAFGELMRGEYNREFGEMIVQATQKAYDSVLNEQGPVGRILNALGQKYGTAPGDYEALAAAVEGRRREGRRLLRRHGHEEGHQRPAGQGDGRAGKRERQAPRR